MKIENTRLGTQDSNSKLEIHNNYFQISVNKKNKTLTAGGVLVALGIIYGDIGTSPLYVFNAIIGNRVISSELVLGALSCIVWTLTLITSLKYIYLALNADNKGEGGIFALYA